jgi:four helix bundle protein
MKPNIVRDKSFDFALAVIELYKHLKAEKEFVISRQILRSATSIGANIEEAGAAQSKRDFIAKMAISSKEARETNYWLRLIIQSKITNYKKLNDLLKSSEELIRLLTSIIKTAQASLNGK